MTARIRIHYIAPIGQKVIVRSGLFEYNSTDLLAIRKDLFSIGVVSDGVIIAPGSILCIEVVK